MAQKALSKPQQQEKNKNAALYPRQKLYKDRFFII